AEEITAVFEEEETEEIEFLPEEEEEFTFETPAEEITAVFEEEETEEIEFLPEEEKEFTLETPAEKITPVSEEAEEIVLLPFEEEPEEINLLPFEEIPATDMAAEEVLNELSEEESEEIYLLPEEDEEDILPETPAEEITAAFSEEPEKTVFLDEQTTTEPEEQTVKTPAELSEEDHGDIEFISEEKEWVPEISAANLTAPMDAELADVKEVSPHEAFAFALDEIKQVIKAEFKALRAELKLWRESK
ncbi:MAG: hypothetical protein JW755_03235, partial [Candidatus Aminicenantes bacterium]|nr:hypothetical protein [Candidatus Aminicenantes bacterium]